jgi:tetratricopeptide (TPR) repeat protein
MKGRATRALGLIVLLVTLARCGAAFGSAGQAPGDVKTTAERQAAPAVTPPDDGRPAGERGLTEFVFSLDQRILFYLGRVKANPGDFVSLRYLGEFLAERGKEKGDLADLARAEAVLRKSVSLFSAYPPAQTALAAVLCERHKFGEGLEIAGSLYRQDPRNLGALVTIADALVELGQYEEGEKTLGKLYERAPEPQVLARLANLAELKGQTEEAARLMRQAADLVQAKDGPKAAAWYQSRMGDFALSAGRLDDAAREYQSVVPGTDAYHDATAGLGRVRAAQGKLSEAVELLKKAVDIGPDPSMLAALGDLLAKTGREEEAKRVYDRLEQRATLNAEYRRELANFYADHDRHLPKALELAQIDIAERKDIYGYDTLAWALFKNGRAQEAARASAEALKLGTRDARLHYHAGLIHLKLGDPDKAREHLGRALALNPHFSIVHAEQAKKVLESLEADRNAVGSR